MLGGDVKLVAEVFLYCISTRCILSRCLGQQVPALGSPSPNLRSADPRDRAIGTKNQKVYIQSIYRVFSVHCILST